MKNSVLATVAMVVLVSAGVALAGFDDSNSNGIIYWSPDDLSSTMVTAAPGETVTLFALINNNNLNYGHEDANGNYDPNLNWAPAIGYQIGAYWDTDVVDGSTFVWDNNPGYDGPNGQGDPVSIYNDHTYWLFANANYGEWNMSKGEVARYDHYVAYQVQSNRGIWVGAYHPYAYLYENSIITQFTFTVPESAADVESTGFDFDGQGNQYWYHDSSIGVEFAAWNVYENPTLLSSWSVNYEAITLRVIGTAPQGGVTGDFDGDGDVDADDIDLLMANLGGDPAVYDLTSDGVVDQADVDEWVFNIVPIGENVGTVYGDFNLDGEVNAGDLALLATNYGTVGDWGWATGDGNGDGNVDAGDLAMLATNYGTVVHTVPEPVTMSLLAIGGAALLRRRSR
jgi:hypothetical protein